MPRRSPEHAAGRDAPAQAPVGGPERGPIVAGNARLLWLVAGVVTAYAILWLIGQGPLDHVYTAEWVSRRVAWFFAPLTLLVAVLTRRPLPTVLSVLGLVIGVVIGELIGGRVLAVREARLDAELATGSLQSWAPLHPGWWIASLVFVGATVGAALVARRPGR